MSRLGGHHPQIQDSCNLSGTAPSDRLIALSIFTPAPVCARQARRKPAVLLNAQPEKPLELSGMSFATALRESLRGSEHALAKVAMQKCEQCGTAIHARSGGPRGLRTRVRSQCPARTCPSTARILANAAGWLAHSACSPAPAAA